MKVNLKVTDYLQNSIQYLNDREYKCQYDIPTKFYNRAGGWLLDLNLNQFKDTDKIKEVVFTDYVRHNNKVKKKVKKDEEGLYYISNNVKYYLDDLKLPFDF